MDHIFKSQDIQEECGWCVNIQGHCDLLRCEWCRNVGNILPTDVSVTPQKSEKLGHNAVKVWNFSLLFFFVQPFEFPYLPSCKTNFLLWEKSPTIALQLKPKAEGYKIRSKYFINYRERLISCGVFRDGKYGSKSMQGIAFQVSFSCDLLANLSYQQKLTTTAPNATRCFLPICNMNQRIASYLDTKLSTQGSINHPFDVRICLAFEILCATKYKAWAAESVPGRRTHNCIVWFHSQLQSFLHIILHRC